MITSVEELDEVSGDWLPMLKDWQTDIAGNLLATFAPPSDESIWKWLEQYYELDPTSAIPGFVNFLFFPASRYFFDRAQDYRTRRITVMKCAQSGFTENAVMLLAWKIKESPVQTMWIMAQADQCEEFGKDRLYPAMERCRPVFELCPKNREDWTKKLLRLLTMSLYLRGSNSLKKLQGNPIGLIICDERREWKKGAIGTVRKRLTTFSDKLEISIGVAGEKHDELHTDWLEGSQTFFNFTCPHCNTTQPWRFGRKPSVLFPAPRVHGGIVFDNYEATKPDGKWDYAAVLREARYECENADCLHRFSDTDKPALIASVTETHRNPKAFPQDVSLAVTSMMMPWADCGFGAIAVRFLKALEARKHGDMLPYKTFVTEDEGEPFEHPDAYKLKGDLTNRIGNYKMMEFWVDRDKPLDTGYEAERGSGEKFELEKNTILIKTFDRQLMHNWVLIRQWRFNGDSRLIWYGKQSTYDDIRNSQITLRIKDKCVYGDDGGPKVSEFRQFALQCGWTPIKGDDPEYFSVAWEEKGEKKYVRQGWAESDFDPGVGTVLAKRAKMKAYLMSLPWYKDKLYFLFVAGIGPLWEIAKDAPPEYFDQMNRNQYRERVNAKGETEGYFHEVGDPHAGDCESMQCCVADISGLTRYLPKPNKPSENKQPVKKEGEENGNDGD